jgi:hypothetical protein
VTSPWRALERYDMKTVKDIENIASWVLLTEKPPYALADVTADQADDNYFIVGFWHADRQRPMVSVRCDRRATTSDIEGVLRGTLLR